MCPRRFSNRCASLSNRACAAADVPVVRVGAERGAVRPLVREAARPLNVLARAEAVERIRSDLIVAQSTPASTLRLSCIKIQIQARRIRNNIGNRIAQGSTTLAQKRRAEHRNGHGKHCLRLLKKSLGCGSMLWSSTMGRSGLQSCGLR